MARRRYISTKISTDNGVNRLAVEHGDFAALLYTWLIPHAEDSATVTGDPEELLMTVCPGRRDKTAADIVAALEGMAKLRLIHWDRQAMLIYFPTASFYKYQTYVRPINRRAEEQREAPEISDDQRETPENAASPSLSLSPSLSKNDDDKDARTREADKKNQTTELAAGAVAWRSWYEQVTAGAWPSAKWADHLDGLVAKGMDHALIIEVLDAKRATTSHFLSAASAELGRLFAAGVLTTDQAQEHRARLAREPTQGDSPPETRRKQGVSARDSPDWQPPEYSTEAALEFLRSQGEKV